MVLKCKDCGWTGKSLIPNYDRQTADCPSCGRPFKGILPHNAIHPDDIEKKLTLSLDDLHDGEFTGTKYDFGGRGHDIVIDEKNKEKALDEMTSQFRAKAEKLFKPACKKCGDGIDLDFENSECHICDECCLGHQDCKECEFN